MIRTQSSASAVVPSSEGFVWQSAELAVEISDYTSSRNASSVPGVTCAMGMLRQLSFFNAGEGIGGGYDYSLHLRS